MTGLLNLAMPWWEFILRAVVLGRVRLSVLKRELVTRADVEAVMRQ